MYKLLGGFTNKVPVYIAGGYYEEGKGLGELAEEMVVSVEMGARAVKMKIGGAPINEDVERVRVVREAVGPDVKIMVDANCAYRHYEAQEIARKMEPYDVLLVRGTRQSRRLRGPPAGNQLHDNPRSHRRKRVHPLRIPRAHRGPMLRHTPARRPDHGRRNRVHEGPPR